MDPQWHAGAPSGGHFLCVMAGRSGGFPFGPWQSITQMEVSGPVSAGTLQIAAGAIRADQANRVGTQKREKLSDIVAE